MLALAHTKTVHPSISAEAAKLLIARWGSKHKSMQQKTAGSVGDLILVYKVPKNGCSSPMVKGGLTEVESIQDGDHVAGKEWNASWRVTPKTQWYYPADSCRLCKEPRGVVGFCAIIR